MWEIRKRRVESLLREKISVIILQGELKDPRLKELVTITEVSVSRDLGAAKVFVSVMGGAKEQKSVVDILNHAAGFVQKTLARKISLRQTPRLNFIRDDSLERGFRITQKLKDIVP
jgi:ribosome-binding factor A